MLTTEKAIIVEGKYDKIRLSQFVDAPIIVTDGFGIFKNPEKKALISRLAERHGIIILTDSDSAGMMIRNHIRSFVPENQIINVYAPEILGKEKRKTAPSKEGVLGVEGIPSEILKNCFLRAGVFCDDCPPREKITKADLFQKGLYGGENSAEKREKLLKDLGLPHNMTTPSMLTALNSLMSREEFLKL